MLSFASDYTEGACEEILQKLAETNRESLPGYGMDRYCQSAARKIQEATGCPEAEVYFLVGGTQTNAAVISSMLAPYEGVVAAQTGHVSIHEAGDANHDHMVFPGMVYLSHPTEYGTLYSRKELQAISEICRSYEIPLYLDGARLGYGLAGEENDLSLSEIAHLCDVFYIGGTKCGALFGEAVVILKESLKKDFRYMIKQRGGMFAKGRLLGIQFDTLFTDGLYEAICGEAVKKAMTLREAFLAKGISMYGSSMTNQQFPILTDAQKEALAKDFAFEYWGEAKEGKSIVRFCTSWATNDAQIKALTDAIAAL